MVYDIISLPVVILFVISGIGLYYYAIKLNKQFADNHNFTNSILTIILWITAGIVYPLFFSTYSQSIMFFQILSSLFICVFTPMLIILILYYQYRFVIKRSPEVKESRNFANFLKGFDERDNKTTNSKSHLIKTDLHRKLLHLVPAGLVILLWVFAVYIWGGLWNADLVWGISREEFGRFLILTAGYSGLLVFGAFDFIRLSFIFENYNLFHLIPDNVLKLLGKTMKRKENFEFIRPIVLALSFIPIFFFPFCIFAAAILIATIGDGAASVFGLRFGKKKFPKKSEKTIVGYIAGFLASLGIGFATILIFKPTLNGFKILLIGISGGFTFFIIDLLNLPIDDNILNPFFSSLIMGSIYFLL
ncbi:MAG: hypothetical protein ACXABO_15165 [Promethearchaeota archaeon]|jgi:dolichol kinase